MKTKKALVALLAVIQIIVQTLPAAALVGPTTTSIPVDVNAGPTVAIPGKTTTINPTVSIPSPEQIKQAAAYQVARGALEALGFKFSQSTTNPFMPDYSGMVLCFIDCNAGKGGSDTSGDALVTLLLDAYFQNKTVPESVVSVLTGGSVEGVAASTIEGQLAQIEQTLGIPGAISSNGTFDGAMGGSTSGTVGSWDGALGGAFGNGTGSPTGTGSLTNLSGLLGGQAVSGSDNATFTYQASHAFVRGVVELNPPNPLKDNPFTIKATGIGQPPAGGSVSFSSQNPISETVTYNNAGVYTKEYTLAYTYTPPPVNGKPQPPQPGTLTIKVNFRVSEFSGMGGSGNGQYGDMGGGAATGSSGIGSININGGVTGSGNLLNQAGQSSNMPALPSGFGTGTGAGNVLTSAAAGALTGDVSLPFGNMINGTSMPNINIAMNGMDKLGSAFMSITDTFHNLLRGTNAPRDTQVAGTGTGGATTSVQSDKTPEQVRKENFSNMTSILKTSAQYIAAKGIKPSDIPKLYDKDSAYTAPREAWDMNRLTRFMSGDTDM